ncbi:hypothetical protein BDV19DRAFT_386688 [Aspergillus venezuelensis]
MTRSAAQKGLFIPEILEAILIHLEITDLLVSAQRVNKHWLSVITQSTQLQQALFFKQIAPPTNPYSAYEISPDDDPHSYPNAHFGNVFFNLNGCGNLHTSAYFYTNLHWWTRARGDANGDAVDQSTLERRQKAFTRSGASWRRMLVAQPAQPALGYVHVNRDAFIIINKGYVETITADFGSSPLSETGLRFGVLYDFVQYHAAHHKYCLLFRVVWGRPYGHEYLNEADKPSEELLRQTSVIMQLEDRRPHLGEEPPVNVATFDLSFRSEDFRLPVAEVVEVQRQRIREQ